MKLLILGSGTSTGVPVIACGCKVCSSKNPKNSRTRSSLLIRTDEPDSKNILIDTATDLRAQCLANKINRVDAVLFTHPHADHIHGVDELRAFNMAQGGPIPCYGSDYTIRRMMVMFDYIFDQNKAESWRPHLLTNIVDSKFSVFGTRITPIEIYHGHARIFGYRIGTAAYLTDCSGIPPESVEKLKGLDVLIIGALRHKTHPTHMNVTQALEVSGSLKPKRTIFTHLSHNIDFEEDSAKLPKGVEFAYDGMEIEV